MSAGRLRLWANLAWRTGPLEWKREFGHAVGTSAAAVLGDDAGTGGASGARVPSRSHEWWATCSRADAMSALNVELAGGSDGCPALREVEALARPFAVAASKASAGAGRNTGAPARSDLPPPPAPPATSLISVDGVQVSTRVRGKLRLRAQNINPVAHQQVLRHMLASAEAALYA